MWAAASAPTRTPKQVWAWHPRFCPQAKGCHAQATLGRVAVSIFFFHLFGAERLKAALRMRQFAAESLKVVEELEREGCKVNWTERIRGQTTEDRGQRGKVGRRQGKTGYR